MPISDSEHPYEGLIMARWGSQYKKDDIKIFHSFENRILIFAFFDSIGINALNIICGKIV